MKNLKDKMISKMVLGPILNSINTEDENFLNLIDQFTKHEKAASIIQTFGLIGTFIESILVLYLFASSMIGFYTIPKFSKLKPEKGKTSLQKLIINCILLLSISSALPLLCITLNFVDAQDIFSPGEHSNSKFLEKNEGSLQVLQKTDELGSGSNTQNLKTIEIDQVIDKAKLSDQTNLVLSLNAFYICSTCYCLLKYFNERILKQIWRYFVVRREASSCENSPKSERMKKIN